MLERVPELTLPATREIFLFESSETSSGRSRWDLSDSGTGLAYNNSISLNLSNVLVEKVDSRNAFVHEHAHNLAYIFDIVAGPPKGWEEANRLDRSATVSAYASTSPTEDFAETFRWYVTSDRGRNDMETAKKIRHKVAYLDNFLSLLEENHFDWEASRAWSRARATLPTIGFISVLGVGVAYPYIQVFH